MDRKQIAVGRVQGRRLGDCGIDSASTGVRSQQGAVWQVGSLLEVECSIVSALYNYIVSSGRGPILRSIVNIHDYVLFQWSCLGFCDRPVSTAALPPISFHVAFHLSPKEETREREGSSGSLMRSDLHPPHTGIFNSFYQYHEVSPYFYATADMISFSC